MLCFEFRVCCSGRLLLMAPLFSLLFVREKNITEKEEAGGGGAKETDPTMRTAS